MTKGKLDLNVSDEITARLEAFQEELTASWEILLQENLDEETIAETIASMDVSFEKARASFVQLFKRSLKAYGFYLLDQPTGAAQEAQESEEPPVVEDFPKVVEEEPVTEENIEDIVHQKLLGPKQSIPRDIGEAEDLLAKSGISAADARMFDADEKDDYVPIGAREPAKKVKKPTAPGEWKGSIRKVQELLIPFKSDPDPNIRTLVGSCLTIIASILEASSPEEVERFASSKDLWEGLSTAVSSLRKMKKSLGKYNELKKLQVYVRDSISGILNDLTVLEDKNDNA